MLHITEFSQYIIRLCVICVYLQNSHIWIAAKVGQPVCKNAECRSLGNAYLKHMNQQVNPCEDFYDYVCQGWSTQHPKPEYIDHWNTVALLRENAYKVLKTLLEDKKISNFPKVEQAKKLYRECMKLPFMEKLRPEVLKGIMTKVGIWPMFLPKDQELPAAVTWWSIENQYIKKTGESAIFSFNVVGDPQNNFQTITRLKQLKSPYGSLIRNENIGFFLKEKHHYTNFLRILVQNIAWQDPGPLKHTIEKDIQDVIKFREKLREICQNNLPIHPELHIMTIKELQNWYSSEAKSNSNADINWLETIRAIYKNSNAILDSSIVQVEKSYFKNLIALLKTTSKRVLVNHIHLYFAERHLLFNLEMQKELKNSVSIEVYKTGVIRSEEPRWLWCIENHNMIVTVKKMYVDATFSNTRKLEIAKLIDYSKKILQEQISESTWLDDSTKLWSLDKTKAITYSIGYPDWYNASATTNAPNIIDLDVLEPNVYYATIYNRVYVSASYLQLPIYSLNTPYVTKFGAIVSMISHELYHAFDDNGQKYNKTGEEQGWPRDMVKKYKKQAECFKKIYGEFKKEEVKKYNVGFFDKLGIRDTSIEDIADAMGLKLSYRAYKMRLQQEEGVCPTLPGFETTSCNKLFFIAFANAFCGASSKINEKRALFGDMHSLPRVRVNAAVANMEEFNAAFGCKPNMEIYEKTCDIWKT